MNMGESAGLPCPIVLTCWVAGIGGRHMHNTCSIHHTQQATARPHPHLVASWTGFLPTLGSESSPPQCPRQDPEGAEVARNRPQRARARACHDRKLFIGTCCPTKRYGRGEGGPRRGRGPCGPIEGRRWPVSCPVARLTSFLAVEHVEDSLGGSGPRTCWCEGPHPQPPIAHLHTAAPS